ncbi:hypothetical protein AKJ09_04005 [Labilithrix luteola]|uniref:Uncharacterized protein n=1 Tax=Labilithrix luteola TaxID=1391654 RepID=A0A0K1PVE7_9BACT|nr:hypothetical protein [Labilithrix luteola]AKU97341.1 hypothetical protein AKJ09_04005 [Labilithrix luteola]
MESSDFEPLVRGGTNEANRRLLASAKDDAAGPGARDTMLAALGVPAVPAHERLAVRLGRAFGRSGGVYLPGALLVVFVGAVTSGAVMLGGSPSKSSEPTVASHATLGAVSVPSDADGNAAAAAAPTSAPVVTPDSLPSAPATSKPMATPAPTDTLGRESARVEAVRAALARNDAARAVTLLDAYDREFSPGAFAIEVSVLRIEALARLGQTERARRLGKQFLAEHRQGAFARRVTATLEALPPE